MEHPNEKWSETIVGDRIERILLGGLPIGRDIRFDGLEANDRDDYLKCFIWEYCRTRIFKGENLPVDENLFPFYVNTFPDKAYLDELHPYETRMKWELQLFDVSTDEQSDNLLTESLGTTEKIKITLAAFNIDESLKIPAEKVPITLHINPNWSLTKTKHLFCDQIASIYYALGAKKEYFEQKGHDFIDPLQNHEIKIFRTNLKILGHYRLNECVHLSEPNFRDSYGKGKFKSERKFREQCFKRLKHLPLKKFQR